MVLVFDSHLLNVGQGESANAFLKILEEPLIEVTLLESNPPVQDSAKDIFNLFLFNNFTTF